MALNSPSDNHHITIGINTGQNSLIPTSDGFRSGNQAVIAAMQDDPDMSEQEQTRDYDRRTFLQRTLDFTLRRKKHFGRTVFLDGSVHPPRTNTPKNVVRNQKYTVLSFIPLVLYEQFKFFFNLYFLLVALTQFFPPLKVGTYMMRSVQL